MPHKIIKGKDGDLKILEKYKSKTKFQIKKNKKYYETEFKVLCFCGKIFSVAISNLVKVTNSCGCYGIKRRKENKFIHGHSRNIKYLNGYKKNITPTYRSWVSFKMGCLNKNTKMYQCYGGKGIKICDDWLDFKNFLRDMGEKPLNHRLKRKDKYADFEPDNCEWVLIKKRKKNKK